MAYLLLPTGGIWLILRVLAELPANDWAVRVAETIFALSGLYMLLRVAQALMMSLVDEQMRAPRLLLDVLRIVLSLVWGSVVVSRIWNVNLGSLLAAMGVGSIALAFALQQFLGNLLYGLGLLSAHKFSIGDWIIVEGKAAEVVEMDWRTVTLVTGAGDQVVVPNSTLAKGNLTIVARGRNNASATVPLTLGVDIPPEQVRDAVIEAGRAMLNLAEPDGVKCFVTDIGERAIKYNVVLSVANPRLVDGPRDEFLSKFWYLAQRRGLRLDPSPGPDAAARLAHVGTRRRLPSRSGRSAATCRGKCIPSLSSRGRVVERRRVCARRFPGRGGPAGGKRSDRRGRDPTGTRTAWELMVLQEMLAGGASPVQVVADLDSDVLAIPAQALVDAMDHHPLVARDISAVTEARRQAISPLNRELRVVA